MSKFGKFLSGQKPAQATTPTADVAVQDSRPQLSAAAGMTSPLATTGQSAVSTTGDLAGDGSLDSYEDRKAAYQKAAMIENIRPRFAICLDATGSMSALIEDAKSSIMAIIERMKVAVPTVEVQFIIYRDYKGGGSLTGVSPLTNDATVLRHWLSRIDVCGGGGNSGEAVDAALQIAFQGDFAAVFVAGDEPSLPQSDLPTRAIHAHIWARKFGEKSVPVHTFVVGRRADTIEDFRLIAEKSGGQTGQLDGSDAMRDMAVMAMLARVRGAGAVRNYLTQYGNRLGPGATDFAKQLLLGK